jgi:hypothetical protein
VEEKRDADPNRKKSDAELFAEGKFTRSPTRRVLPPSKRIQPSQRKRNEAEVTAARPIVDNIPDPKYAVVPQSGTKPEDVEDSPDLPVRDSVGADNPAPTTNRLTKRKNRVPVAANDVLRTDDESPVADMAMLPRPPSLPDPGSSGGDFQSQLGKIMELLKEMKEDVKTIKDKNFGFR